MFNKTKSNSNNDIKQSSKLPSFNSSTSNSSISSLNNNNLNDEINELKELIKSNSRRILIIMRGAPGSGKSTLALQLKFDGVILSADNYFINKFGEYFYDKSKINDAHTYTRTQARQHLTGGTTPIIIDNTNIQIWEFEPYIKMACEYDYLVKLVEPNTKWKFNANELSKRNCHNVPFDRIKYMLKDYQENINVDALIHKYKTKLEEERQLQLSKRKSYGLLTASKVEWSLDDGTSTSSINNNENKIEEEKINELINNVNIEKFDKESQTGELFGGRILTARHNFNSKQVNTNVNKTPLKAVLTYDRSCDTFDLEDDLREVCLLENVNILKEMFPNRNESLFLELLHQHNNDLATVASIISDSIEFEDIDYIGAGMGATADFRPIIDTNKNVPFESAFKTAQKPIEVYNPLSLKEICEIELNKIEYALQRHFSTEPTTTTTISEMDEIIEDLSPPNRSKCTVNDKLVDYSDDDDGNEETGEKMFTLKLNKDFARELFKQFSDPYETFDENDNFEVELNLTLASHIYNAWIDTKIKIAKNGKKHASFKRQSSENDTIDMQEIENRIKQIELDAQYALEVFEQENMRDPIHGHPIYLSDNGVNSASISLRQIMAEQSAAENIKSRQSSQQRTALNATSNSHDPTIAVFIKRRKLYDLYTPSIDKHVIDQLFTEKNYNINETCEHIENKYHIRPNPHSTILPAKDLHSKINNSKHNRSLPSSLGSQKSSQSNMRKSDSYSNEYRELAHQYFQIRQEYYEKANQAFERGWGAVAQYYAEMGHKQSIRMKESNEAASKNIFAINNADLNSSNVLDLHGLHVKEAISILKQVLYKKKQELKNKVSKQKTYLYVITGCGRHSENQVPVLRPSIINYLNQNFIKYKEPNVGLLRVNLM